MEIFGYFDLINDNGMCEFKETLGIFPALTFMPVSYVSPVLIKNIEVLILQLKILYVLSETSSNKTYCYYQERPDRNCTNNMNNLWDIVKAYTIWISQNYTWQIYFK